MQLFGKIKRKAGCGFCYYAATALLWFLGLVLVFFLGNAPAYAQMSNQPWGFKQQNRASLAALMRQVDREGKEQLPSTYINQAYETLVCGGDGRSTATGNSTCIIMSNADGQVNVGQDAQGNQSATNQGQTSSNDSESEEEESLSDALDDIGGDN